MIRKSIFCAFCVLAGCATPVKHIEGNMERIDDNTQLATTERLGGFAIEVRYARYQFIPESDAVAVACKQALTAAAYNVAEKRGKKITPMNEQRIQISMGRNGLTGITSCRAYGIVDYAQ